MLQLLRRCSSPWNSMGGILCSLHKTLHSSCSTFYQNYFRTFHILYCYLYALAETGDVLYVRMLYAQLILLRTNWLLSSSYPSRFLLRQLISLMLKLGTTSLPYFSISMKGTAVIPLNLIVYLCPLFIFFYFLFTYCLGDPHLITTSSNGCLSSLPLWERNRLALPRSHIIKMLMIIKASSETS